MSVYTTVTPTNSTPGSRATRSAALVDLEPIASGIENTNYFVTTDKGRYVLTLYERLPAEELPFYLNLMAHLARAGVEVPAPEPDRTGAFFSLLNGKPAGLVDAPRRRARSTRPMPRIARQSAQRWRRMHVASQTYRARLTNRRGPAWWRQAARAVRPFLTAEHRRAARRPRSSSRPGSASGKLPKGAIHGDLFCDNVLFDDDRVAGIIDFGFAATDFFAYDLAIAVNDWCVDATRRRRARSRAVRRDGRGLRRACARSPPTSATQWPALLRAAALRFWLSRLYDLHLPRPGELTHAHDPEHFERILRAARGAAGALADADAAA